MASFEEQLSELEQVVAKLESGGLTLDESVTLFEDGMRLSKACKAHLASADSRIQVLLEPSEKGAVRLEDLDVEVDEDEDDEYGSVDEGDEED